MLVALRLICLVALFMGWGIDSWSKPPTPSYTKSATEPKADASQDQKDATASQPPTNGAPVIVEISKAPIIQVEAPDKTDKANDYSSSEWWLVYTTIGLVLITGALALYTARLYRATVALGSEAKASGAIQAEKMERSIAATQKAAEATEQTADIAEKTLIATQRPWVNINVEIHGRLFFDSNGAGIRLRITTENTGTTPATNILAHPMIFCREQQPYQAREIIERRSATFGIGGGMGHTLFKDNKFPEIITPSMDAREYAGETAISPFVLVAVKYNSTLGNETYMTAKLYHLLRLDPTKPGQAFAVYPGEDVPLNLLKLQIIGSHAI